MAVNPEFHRFVTGWLAKAEQIQYTCLDSYFDKFFTLFVVFNRLYAEATFILWRRGDIHIADDRPLPDKKSATEYISDYLGDTTLIEGLDSDTHTHAALACIITLLEQERFYIRLHTPSGDRQRVKDLHLLAELKSADPRIKAVAVLKTIYYIRCNMFHGHKEFHEVQIDILSPIIVIMRKVIELLWAKIRNE